MSMVSADLKRYRRPGTLSELSVIPLVNSVIAVVDTSLWEDPSKKSAETFRLQPSQMLIVNRNTSPGKGLSLAVNAWRAVWLSNAREFVTRA